MIKVDRRASDAHQQVHHVGFVVSQCFDGVKDVHRVLVTQHLTHDTDGTERAAAPAAVPETHTEHRL